MIAPPAVIKKNFLKPKCKVTFLISEDIVSALIPSVGSGHVVGDFNEWEILATPMNKKGNTFEAIVDLTLDSEFQFRYLVNTTEWHNGWEADRYVPNPFCEGNSVVMTVPE